MLKIKDPVRYEIFQRVLAMSLIDNVAAAAGLADNLVKELQQQGVLGEDNKDGQK